MACVWRTDWRIPRNAGLEVKDCGFCSGGIEDVRPRANWEDLGLGRRERRCWPGEEGSG